MIRKTGGITPATSRSCGQGRAGWGRLAEKSFCRRKNGSPTGQVEQGAAMRLRSKQRKQRPGSMEKSVASGSKEVNKIYS